MSSTNINIINDETNTEFLIDHPKELIKELDKYIIGNKDVKEAIATSLYLRKYGIINNILIKGKTGSGKSEIVRILSKILNIPVLVIDGANLSPPAYVGTTLDDYVSDFLSQQYVKYKNNFSIVNEKYLDNIAKKFLVILLKSIGISTTVKEVDKYFNTSIVYYDFLYISFFPRLNKFQHLKNKETIEEAVLKLLNNFSSFCKNKSNLEKLKDKSTITELLSETYNSTKSKLIEVFIKSAEINNKITELINKSIIFVDEIDKIAYNNSDQCVNQSSHNKQVQYSLLKLIEEGFPDIHIKKYSNGEVTNSVLVIGSGCFNFEDEKLVPELVGRFHTVVENEEITKDLYLNYLKNQHTILNKYLSIINKKVKVEIKDNFFDKISDLAVLMNKKENYGFRIIDNILQLVFRKVILSLDDPIKSLKLDCKYVEKAIKESNLVLYYGYSSDNKTETLNRIKREIL